MRKLWLLILVVVLVVAGLLIADTVVGWKRRDKPGTVKDEALEAGRKVDSMAAADEDYFRDMDYGVTKDPEALRAALDPYLPGITAADAVTRAVRGRNNWIVWTAGNDRLWDVLSVRSAGNLDFLKTLSSHPSMAQLYSRDTRWQVLGLVNEPCFKKATGPRQDRWGLWLDERVTGPDCPPDPFENERKYLGVKYKARGTGKLAVGSYYGYATGVVGLRLFPNPYFDEKAQNAWDAERYYTDPAYYDRADLVKPYRVGMSCGFCHVGPNPTNPPADPENPAWANLNSNPGAQYFWVDRIFKWDMDKLYPNEPRSFVYQLFHTSRPGALDTSLVSSDQINNPRTMNAIYNVGARLELARKWGSEKLGPGSVDNKQFNEFVPPGTPLAKFYDPKAETVLTPHVLKDGADSVGALGALNRVYVNIGLFSEEWLLHFPPLFGGSFLNPISPIRISDCQKNSTYWEANVAQTTDLALFFLASAKPDYLRNAPGGAEYLARDAGDVPRGQEVFAERCARCHSSKLPDKAFTEFFQPGCIGPSYLAGDRSKGLKCWNDYWQWTKTDEFKNAMKAIVARPDFLADNFLSTDLRVPITLLETNACSPLATNAIRDNIWDNFSSETYKQLPSVGTIQVQDPFTGATSDYPMPAGGRGYTRPASLASLWSTAPYLQNNSVGEFKWTGTIGDRLEAFEDGIRKMLWPEKREGTFSCKTRSGKSHPGTIDVTPYPTYLTVAGGYLPPALAGVSGWFAGWFPNIFSPKGGVQIGPIPKGTPINLLSNIDLMEGKKVVSLLWHLKRDLAGLSPNATNEEATKAFYKRDRVNELLGVSKCKDFVVNRGHYFGTDFLPPDEGEPGLSDADKHALIAFLKTF